MTPGHYACHLLHTLGIDDPAIASADTRPAAQLWAQSGAQYLTGEPDGPPLACPAPLASCAQGAWLALSAVADGVLDPGFPAYRLLGERAALLGLQRRGAISPGGACRLLDCIDGQLALNLPRADDWQLLPAWLERPTEDWDDVALALRTRACAALVERGRLLGLAVAASRPPATRAPWYCAQRLRLAAARTAATGRRALPLVIDLSALWAGPLCTQLLGELGARVIKVESVSRPDGARLGPPQFFDLLNHGKQSVALDLNAGSGRRQLRALLARADIVVESARPRALEQMGIHAADIVRERDGQVWVSITGHGRAAPAGNWIAYGDDAGVDAGLSSLLRERHGRNLFCSDAIADPLAGLHAALLAWAAWRDGGGVLLDVSLRAVVAHCVAVAEPDAAGPVAPGQVAQPAARAVTGRAAPLGSGTRQILRELGIRG